MPQRRLCPTAADAETTRRDHAMTHETAHDEAALRGALHAIGQEHVLHWLDELSEDASRALLDQVAALDFGAIPGLIERYVTARPEAVLPSVIEPAPFYPVDPVDATRPWDAACARNRGEELLRGGRVACFTVAGGQGSRLGFDGPKGCYPGGAVSGIPLFEMFARGIKAASTKYGATIPWYIMTSPLNHDATVAFFAEHNHFGLSPGAISFFAQGVMPSFDRDTGRLLMAAKNRIATNPDGHGGSITALFASGALDDMAGRGVEHISYFQVDNPLVPPVDPVFLGLHANALGDSSGEMSSKMLRKTDPAEKVGLFTLGDGRLQMIEYCDLPEVLAGERGADGSLRFAAGNPAIHLLSVAFVRRLNEDSSFSLPFHRADKKVAHLDPQTGAMIEPTEPNAVKLERFVFDALPLADKSIVLEVDRVEQFAPIKNATGADSPATSARLQTERAARWLEAAGVEIPRDAQGLPDCTLELSPMTALEARDLLGRDLPERIERGASVVV